MANIKNTSQCNIVVSTPTGEFIFKAGETLELSDDRADLVSKHGAVYFTMGELVSDAEFSATKADEAGVSIVEDATKEVAEQTAEEVKPVEVVKPAPAAVKAAVKPAPAAKK